MTPAEVLRRCFREQCMPDNADEAMALAEIERRAKIEARAEAWLSQAAPPGYDGPPMLRRLIWTFDGQRHGWFTDQWYFDPDKYTALEKALDAAGAP